MSESNIASWEVEKKRIIISVSRLCPPKTLKQHLKKTQIENGILNYRLDMGFNKNDFAEDNFTVIMTEL